MSLFTMLVNEITDRYLRENFKRLNDFAQIPGMALLNFTRLEITLTEEKTSFKVPHNLGYTPTDIWVTWVTGPALVQFNYDQFDSTNVVLSTVIGTPTKQAPLVLRCFVGAWANQGNS